jgi:hypothetical protein
MEAQPHSRRSLRSVRSGASNVVLALLVALAVALLVAGTSFAAKKTQVDPSIALASVNGGYAATVQPSLGSWVTFDTTYPNTVKNPRIEVDCYQNSDLVFGMGGAVDYSFQLGGAGSIWLWNGGAADCTATLFYFGFHAGHQTYNPLADTSFHANG